MDFLIAAMAAAFVVSVIDHWIDLKIIRGFIAVTVVALLVRSQQPDVNAVIQTSLGAGFLALAVIEVLSNLSRSTVITKGRR